MSIKEAMRIYFDRQAEAYLQKYNSLPWIPYSSEKQTLIYKGHPDEEDWIQWQPVHAKTIQVKGLCPELIRFYSSYYHGGIEGEINGIYYHFPAIYNQADAIHEADWGIKAGKDLFPDENCAIIGSCSKQYADGLTVVYDQDTDSMSIWDYEFSSREPINLSLEELLLALKVIV